MPSQRRFLIGSGALVAAAALVLSGTSVGLASTPAAAPHASPALGAPSPNAPHHGVVQGLQTGPSISINNPASVHAFKVLHRQLLTGSAGPAAQPETIHTNTGTSFDSSTSFQGSQANQSVSTKIKPGNPGTTLYTPTMYPSGGTQGSCIEMSTAYFYTSQVVAAWDWCDAITFVAQVKINRAFMKTYTKHGYYSVQDVQTDPSTNTWTSYLYNYTTGDWEQFYQQHGTSQISGSTDGWDVYELYSELRPNGQSYACKDLRGKKIQANKIMVDNGGDWALADPTNSGHDYDQPLSSFHCKDIKYKVVKSNWHFWVKG